jgi:probable phosphoglycerate mutase
MTIILVRHGETDGNAQRILQTADVPLSARGVWQARRLAERLARLGVQQILASDLTRARETAQAIADRTGLAIELSPLLQERNFGELRGRPYASLESDPFAADFAPPAGETWAEFHERAAQAFRLIEARSRACFGNLVVVTHGLMCRALVARHALVPPSQLPARFDNTSVTVLSPAPMCEVRLLNCCAHFGDIVDERREIGIA